MYIFWLITGPVVGGGLGWLLGRRNSRVTNSDSCQVGAAPS